MGLPIAKWEENNKQRRLAIESQFEAAGVIAYGCTETEIVLVMSTGKTLTIKGFFYSEGPFMEVNGEYMPILET